MVHTPFWLIILVYSGVLLVSVFIQRYLSRLPGKWPGRFLPLFFLVVAIVLSCDNFMQAFQPKFSMLIFITSLTVFLCLMVPAIVCFWIYVFARQERARKYAHRGIKKQAKR